MKKAIYMGIEIRHVDTLQRIFRVEPPLEGFQYVNVSARNFEEYNKRWNSLNSSPFALEHPPETYIFGCSPDGEIINWNELNGSYRGGLSHARALLNAGYEICELQQGD